MRTAHHRAVILAVAAALLVAGLPVQLGGLLGGVARADMAGPAGALHDCAVVGGGGVKCWGLNDSGQLGAPGNRVDIDAFLVLGR